MSSSLRTGILLTNIGSPETPTVPAVRHYLKQFLSDRRVIDLPRWWWLPLLHGVILQTRPRRSAHAYSKIWTPQGSPIIVGSRNVMRALDEKINTPNLVWALGLSYTQPSLTQALHQLNQHHCQRLLLLPLFPQYASATTGSHLSTIFKELSEWRNIPEVRVIHHYYDHPAYISALVNSIREYWHTHGEPERLLFSYHGLPQRYVNQGDPYYQQCMQTTQLVVQNLQLNPARFIVAFQSRFGREEWLKPYTDATLQAWAGSGVKNVDVICPSFAIDCLETLEEINMGSRAIFLKAGGQQFRYIPALNERVDHIEALAQLLNANLMGWRMA